MEFNQRPISDLCSLGSGRAKEEKGKPKPSLFLLFLRRSVAVGSAHAVRDKNRVRNNIHLCTKEGKGGREERQQVHRRSTGGKKSGLRLRRREREGEMKRA